MSEQSLGQAINRVLLAAAHVESPIEFDMSCQFQRNDKFKYRFDQMIPDEAGWYVYPQVSLGNYRLDFLVLAKLAGDDDGYRIVVECDGKDFHSTPEQIAKDKARDDYFRKQGFHIIRFTGSQIHRDAADCVERVANLIPRKYWCGQ